MSDIHPLTTLNEMIAGLLEQQALCVEASNQDTADYNEAMDRIEELTDYAERLEAEIKENHAKLDEYEAVICKAGARAEADIAQLQVLNAKVKELTVADAPRLVKQNKGYKKTIENLKVDKEKLSALANKQSSDIKAYRTASTMKGVTPVYSDPVSGNTISLVPNTFLFEDNPMKGVPKSPILEFYHNDRGISRRGFIGLDGNMHWAAAQNSNPSKDESLVAKEFIVSYCKSNKIKI